MRKIDHKSAQIQHQIDRHICIRIRIGKSALKFRSVIHLKIAIKTITINFATKNYYNFHSAPENLN